MPITCLKSNFNVLLFFCHSASLNRPVIGCWVLAQGEIHLIYDKPCNTFDNKPSNFPLFLVCEQNDYFTRSASAQQLLIPHSRINIRKFCPTVTGKYYRKDLPLSICNKSSKILFKRHLKNIILLNVDLCACVCACVRVCVLMNNKTTKE